MPACYARGQLAGMMIMWYNFVWYHIGLSRKKHREGTIMDNKANRPLDREELSLEQEAKVVGGVQINTANFNTANFNTANFNTANVNIAR